MFGTINRISSHDARYPDAESLEEEGRIKELIGMTPSQENVDHAFAIAKTIGSPTVRHFALSDICHAYLKLSTPQGCKKAYEVAQYKEAQRADIRILLDVIVGVCLRLKTEDTLSLAGTIFESYPKQMALSEHKNEFYSVPVRLNKSPRKVDDLSKRVEDLLIAKGDLCTILGCDARNLVERREFKKALQKANEIQDDISRDGAIAEIFEKCCAYGDTEALGFAFEIAKSKTEFRDNSIWSLIETCRKLGKKESALTFAEEIQNPALKEKIIRKINQWGV